jgi:hypothetical protein
LTGWGKIDNCPSVEMAEAIAGLQSIRTILPLYAGKIHVENNCYSLVTEINGDGSSKSAVSGIARDIRNLLGTLPDYKMSKINRSRNLVAHHLSRLFRNGLSDDVLVGSAPPCVMSLIDRECNEYSVL